MPVSAHIESSKYIDSYSSVDNIEDSLDGSYGLDTLLVHAGLPKHRSAGAAILPIYQTATFGYHGPSQRIVDENTCFYTRPANNPNHKVLSKKLASLEGTEDAVVFSSGMAAISSCMLALLKPGDHFITQAQLYGGTHSLFFTELKKLDIELTVVDTNQPDSWEMAVRPTTKVSSPPSALSSIPPCKSGPDATLERPYDPITFVKRVFGSFDVTSAFNVFPDVGSVFYVEAISNPLLEVGDLRSVAAFCKAKGLYSVIDSTFAPPVNFRPHAVGFDVVLHSATKYCNGHSDIVAGIVASSAAIIGKATKLLEVYGGTLDPHAAFLLQRGLATLGLRMRRQNENGLAAAKYLSNHKMVKKVFYPGLEECKGHSFAKELFSGFGGVLAAELVGGEAAATTFIHELKLPLIAPSLGGVESLICIPAQSTHYSVPPEARKAAGISDSLVRIAFGIEDTVDLIQDLEQALLAVEKGYRSD